MSAVLVGLHPWNAGMWAYAAYDELLAEARARGVLLLMPSGLGNSLYTADAEDEVLRAIDALASVVIVPTSVDAAHALNVSLWGASMGGAGTTTIAFHHPDRFAAATSFFGIRATTSRRTSGRYWSTSAARTGSTRSTWSTTPGTCRFG